MIDLDLLVQDQKGLYYTEYPEGWKFYWRLLSIAEYRKFSHFRNSGLFHSFYLHKKVFDLCYMGNPKLINQDMPLFVPLNIGSLIMYLSGDCFAETAAQEIEQARLDCPTDLLETLKTVILAAYPTYIPEQLESLNRVQLIKLFVNAENTLSIKLPDTFKRLDTAKIVLNSADKTHENKPLNTELENQAITKGRSLWEVSDLIESEYQKDLESKAKAKLSVEQLRKLDTARRN